jgi:Tfp pilus assembly protein PilX
MMIAIIALFIVTTLAAAAVAVGVQTNRSTRQDTNRKMALEAAEAGLQVALYRLNMLNVDATACIGDAPISATNIPLTGWCQSSKTALGNGASYQYYTTPVLGTSATCAGLRILDGDVTQRCVTSVGFGPNGAQARSQVRTAAFAAQPLFPVAGVVGLSSVGLSGNAKVNGSTGSNGSVTANGNATSQGIVLGPGGSYSHSGNASGGTVSNLSSPITLGPVDPGTSNQSLLANCPTRQAAGYPACNDDYRITNGLASPLVVPYDQSSGISWTPATRTLTLSGNSSLTLGGGLYNFCELDLSGNAQIAIAAGVQAEIFIDSPDNPNSGCPAGSGNVSFTGNGAVNAAQNPLAIQLYVYGRNDFSGTASISGNGNFYGILYAPKSQVSISGNGIVSGGVAGRTVSISGNGFNWDSRAATLQASSTGLYYRVAWSQCTPTWTGTNPGSSCG